MSGPYVYDSTTYRAVFERTFTFLSGFVRNTHRYAERLALLDPETDRSWTYAQLGADVDRLAAGLAAYGVRTGDVVAFQLFNSPEFALLYLAAQRVGAIATPINYRFSAGEVAHVLDDSAPAVFVYDDSLAEPVEALGLAERPPGLVVTVPTQEKPATQDRHTSVVAFAELLATGAPVPAYPQTTTWQETTRLYTSGTTSVPKGVSLPSVAEVLTAHDVIMHFPLTPEDRTLNMSAWFHRGGLSVGGPNPVFYVGATAVVMRRFEAQACLDLVAELSLTYLAGTPTNLAMLAEAQSARARDLTSLHGIVAMGAPLERAACLRYQRVLTPRLFNGYGTTEAFWNTILRPVDLPDRSGTVGRACTDDDVAVVRIYDDRYADPDDLVARDGTEVGEVVMRSAKAGLHYVNEPVDDEAHFRDGWFYSGDLATWDAQEYITVVGRRDDMIISGGENVYPSQVEEALDEHPMVADSMVVGMPDERWGQLVVAFVEPAGAGLSAAECDRHCRDHPMLSDFKRPRAYRFVEALPRTATGKKLHYRMRASLFRPEIVAELERP